MLSLCFADIQSLGRFDTSMLTEAQRMELFFASSGFEEIHKALRGSEDDPCTWKKLTCDKDLSIIEIDWHSPFVSLSGSINLSFTPPKLQRLNIFNQKLTGEMDLGVLPDTMEYFCVESCQFFGTLNLEKLPASLESLYVMDNAIDTLLNMQNFSQRLETVYIREQHITNLPIHIGPLPDSDLDIILGYLDPADVIIENPKDAGRVEIEED